ncbi:MAG: 23S rRNA (adenine(2503)-C(2))-methyltransferase [Elusimicrobia bacterium GWA2_61_42]|nr:MAG: 23S rRNA (adenine(2503)-C(2))-methyltransferase [Elusimicrobia bacterium GWA2_61_42]OGR75111.1 MAG: 23S rRNA (adenine(2503)-C(2))-methyltransferase [Elusimicrobia bacterium GWC2_61_25]
MTKPDIRDFTRQELAGAITALGEKGTKADRVFNCLHKKGVATFEAMSGVRPELVKKLQDKYSLAAFPKVEKLVSKLDGTIKLLLTFPDGARAESVILFNKNTVSACISSQVGCACGCTFCATGALGLKRDLKPAEIIAQFVACRREAGKPIDSVVFMGMGEPFLNWAKVKKAIMILSDNKGHNFPQSSITVSTVGVVPVIRELADSHMGVRLAVSLITADEAQRAELAPMSRKYDLRQVIGAARYYGDRTKKSVFFEYIFFDGLNDSPEYAQKLLALIKDLNCKVNLIMYNPGPAAAPYTPGRIEKAKEFQKILVEAGIRTHLRREKGSDIAAACGQLAAGA